MAKRERTFADIVGDVANEAARAKSQPTVHGPGMTPDGDLVSPDGRYFHEVAGSLAPSVASQLVSEKDIVVAYDPCGCGGYCGFEWLDEVQVEKLRRAGNPIMRPKKHRPAGTMSEWRDDGGKPLLLVEDNVRWAGLLADR